jgi:PPM family protein phosphatase
METSERIAALSDIGLRRKNNEDAAYAVSQQYGTLLVIADGMGGHRKGEVASKIVVDSLSIRFNSERKVFNARRSKKFYKKQMKKANQEIYKMSLSGDEYREMGTTAVSCVIGEKETMVFSVGDSRCYVLDTEGNLKQVTKDQTYVELLFESGKITKAEMADHPQKNLLVNAVGINPDLTNCEEFILENTSYHSILLCSDGLYNMVSDEEIRKTMSSTLTAPEKAKELIKKALDNGGNDNVAVAIWDN